MTSISITMATSSCVSIKCAYIIASIVQCNNQQSIFVCASVDIIFFPFCPCQFIALAQLLFFISEYCFSAIYYACGVLLSSSWRILFQSKDLCIWFIVKWPYSVNSLSSSVNFILNIQHTWKLHDKK